MATVWVCKGAGTGPTDQEAENRSLHAMRQELATIIGEDNILRMETSVQPVKPQEDQPTVRRHAYEITEAGWEILTTGFAGPQGFVRCPGSPGDERRQDAPHR